MEELAQLLVLTAEELKEDWEDGGGRHDVFASHDLQARNQSHPHLGMHHRVVLLKESEHLLREDARDLLTVYPGDVRHKLQVIDHVGVFLGWVLFEALQLVGEDVEMGLEFFFILRRLPLNFILQLSERI